MSTTFTIRISKDLKEKMKKLNAEWSEEVRKFIEQRVKHLELIKTIEEIRLRAEKRRVKTDSTRLIREDRER